MANGPFVIFNNFPFAYPPRPTEPENVVLSGFLAFVSSFLNIDVRFPIYFGRGRTSYGFQSVTLEIMGVGIGC